MADYGISHLKALAERGLAFQRKHANLEKKTETSIMRAVGLLEAGAGGLVSGIASGRFPSTTLIGMPPDLVVGGLFGLAGIFHVGGEAAAHVGHFGGGLVAGFMARFGAGIGTKMRNHQPLFSGVAYAGVLPNARPSAASSMGTAAAASFERQVVTMPVG